MRKLLLTVAASAVILSAPSLSPARAAMTAGSALGIAAALADTSAVQDVVYVCRHRYLSSRRLCWWRPNWRNWRWRWRRH